MQGLPKLGAIVVLTCLDLDVFANQLPLPSIQEVVDGGALRLKTEPSDPVWLSPCDATKWQELHCDSQTRLQPALEQRLSTGADCDPERPHEPGEVRGPPRSLVRASPSCGRRQVTLRRSSYA